MNPEQRLLEIQEYLPVKFLILLLGTLIGVLVPERMGIVYCRRPAYDFIFFFCRGDLNHFFGSIFLFLLLGFCLFHDCLHNRILFRQLFLLNCLVPGLGSLITHIDFHRHKSAVLFKNLFGPVLIGKLRAVVV